MSPLKGYKQTAEHKANRGGKRSDKTRALMVAAAQRRVAKMTDEEKRQMTAAACASPNAYHRPKGFKVSAQGKKNMSDAQQRRWRRVRGEE